ncbi:MAG: hypothetical protein IID07_07095 [Gemmatimonadetes bacterium]|nr:hypothetical protein [Gemmatimonadota bacterium]
MMVRIHPGQLFAARVLTLITATCGCGIPLGLSGAPGPSRFTWPSTSAVPQQETESRLSPDSARIRGQVEDAQGRFERIRRRLLPYVWGGGSRPCEEPIGRLCFFHGGDDDWEPLPDPPELVDARDELLATMATAAEHVPADEWILGQRIRYLAEAGRWDDAVRLARDCGGADTGWCSVLEGFSLHGMGRYEAALEGFRRGLEAMDPKEARKWRDPSMLLDGRGSDVLDDAADESEWENLRARVWTLADPLYLVAGNDRESEHYARWTFSKFSDGAQNAWGMRWGDDFEEITLRYGWDRGWERIRPEFGASGRSKVIGHQLPGGKKFTPPGRVLEGPSKTTPGAWVPEEKRPRSTHVPAYVPTLLAGVAQVAVFPRGDSIVVVAATELPTNPETGPRSATDSPRSGDESTAEGPIPWPQPGLLDGPERFGLFLVDEAGRIDGVSRSRGKGALQLTVAAGEYLLSVEAWDPEEGLGGRIRHGISSEALPDDLATLSDLVLLHPGDSLPQSLVSALPSMRSSLQLETGRPFVLGWEIFGLGWRREDVSFELSFSKEGQSFFGRIGRWLGFGGREVPFRLVWSEPGPSEIGPWFRSVEVTIPEVNPGEYVLRLGVTASGREELVQTRMVEIGP